VQKFVGVILNSARFTLALLREKCDSLLSDVSSALQYRSLRKRKLQSLVSKLQWAGRVVYGGRVFMRSLTDAMSTVLHPGHHVAVSAFMEDDLQWWRDSAALHNGILALSARRLTRFVFTDAFLSPVPCIGIFAAGAFFTLNCTQLLAMGLHPPGPDLSGDINVWGCFAIFVAVTLLADYWSGSRVIVLSNNAASVSWVGKGSPRSLEARALVRRLFTLCVSADIRLCKSHIPGADNVLADTLSRRRWQHFSAHASAALSVSSPRLSTAVAALPQGSP
jgi:hypothetical protein